MTPAVANAPLLSARGLSMARGGRDLFDDLSLEVHPGQLWQIEGPNGAGKTSLLRILAGLSRYGYDGDIVRRGELFYLGHQSAVKALLTPRENLAWHVSGEGSYSDAEVDTALASVGLYGYENLYCHTLSAGQQRRVNLARLYLSHAPLWLLDEPFTAIDRTGVAALQERLVAHTAVGGAVLLTSHQQLQVPCEVQSLRLDGGGAA